MEYHDKRKTIIPSKAGIQKGQPTGFRVKPGMTTKVKRLMTHCIRLPTVENGFYMGG